MAETISHDQQSWNLNVSFAGSLYLIPLGGGASNLGEISRAHPTIQRQLHGAFLI